MQPLEFVGQDASQLTLEQYQQIEAAVITAVRKPLVGRTVMPMLDLNNFGIQQLKFYTQTNMGAAAIGMAMIQGAADIVGLTPDTLNIPAIWKDFVIHFRDLESSRTTGVPLDTTFASDAGRRVAELEETLIWEGTGGWIGFMGAVGRLTEASAGSWATAGNAYTDVKDAIAELGNAGYSGKPTLVLTPNQYADLLVIFTNTGIPQLVQVRELCNPVVAHFFADDASALMVMPDPENFELKIAQNVLVHVAERENKDIFCRVYEALVPEFKRGNSICEITGIAV
jgi:uncharacterized linocin/CFP29 family protein